MYAVPHAESEGPLVSALSDLDHEHGFRRLRVEGRLPEDLVGTLYRNGPARFAALKVTHWFDGQAAVTAVRLDGRSAEGAVRLVRTPSVESDLRARTPRYGGFAWPMSWDRRVVALFGGAAIRNLANINVLAWQGRLFALPEVNLPVELDPSTLDSLGETDLEGLVRGRSFNAHPHYVPARRTTYNIGVRIGPKVTCELYALPDRGAPRRLASIPLPGVMEVHDFAVTENHAVIIIPPLIAPSLKVALTGRYIDSLRWRPERGTEVVVVPLDAPEAVVRFRTEPFFVWHPANAFERDGRIVVDLVRYPDFASVAAWIRSATAGRTDAPHAGAYWRGVLDLEAKRATWEERWDMPCEFPWVHPSAAGRDHREVWLAAFADRAATPGWTDHLARLDVETGRATLVDAGPRCGVSEPILVARSDDPRDAWVLALVRDLRADATWLGIWDARRPEDGPVARAWFDQQIPPTLHGTWVPSR